MKKVLRIFVIVLIAAIVLGTFYWLWAKSRPVEITYEIIQASMGAIQNTSVATGKVSPRDEIMIKPQVQGIISELRKEAGDFVKEGEVIAVVKVIPDMGQLNSAESRVRLAEIAMETTRAAHDRQVKLFAEDVISREDEYRRAVEELQNSRDNLDIVREGASKSSSNISNTQVRSTITGMILDVPVKVGTSVINANTFNEGTTIASVADMNGSADQHAQALRQREYTSVAHNVNQRKYEEGLASALELHTSSNRLVQARADELNSRLTWLLKKRMVDYYTGIPFITTPEFTTTPEN